MPEVSLTLMMSCALHALATHFDALSCYTCLPGTLVARQGLFLPYECRAEGSSVGYAQVLRARYFSEALCSVPVNLVSLLICNFKREEALTKLPHLSMLSRSVSHRPSSRRRHALYRQLERTGLTWASSWEQQVPRPGSWIKKMPLIQENAAPSISSNSDGTRYGRASRGYGENE